MQNKSKLANPVPLSPLYINIGIGSSVGRRRKFKEIREVREFKERRGRLRRGEEECMGYAMQLLL